MKVGFSREDMLCHSSRFVGLNQVEIHLAILTYLGYYWIFNIGLSLLVTCDEKYFVNTMTILMVLSMIV